jgi:hypothetical protein
VEWDVDFNPSLIVSLDHQKMKKTNRLLGHAVVAPGYVAVVTNSLSPL